ncbi:MAG: phosphatase PAP2 family protein, partial [Flavobacteriaceae bacterium]
MLEEILQLDRNFFLLLNNLGSETWDGFWLMITSKWSSIPVYLILLILSFKNFGLKKTILLVIAVALMISCTDQLANLFKYGVRRLRPCYEEDLFGAMRLVKASCGGKFAFFSAHAANSFAIAFFFVMLL